MTDLHDVIPADQEARFERRLEALHQDLDVEIALVTVGDVPGTPKQFATRLFNHWGIGDAEAHNGLLVLMVMDQRRLEMETGYGLEPVLPDGWLGTVQARKMVPRFKDGDFAGGLAAGLSAVDQRLRASVSGQGGLVPIRAPAPVVRSPRGPRSEGIPFWMLGVGVLGLAAMGGGGAALRAMDRRARTCPTCDRYMPMLDEVADDAHLDEGQQLEEQIGSVDYQVHVCEQCDHVRTFPQIKWFTGYSTCPRCEYLTRKTTSTVVRTATRHSSGLRRFEEWCRNCDYAHRYTRTIPRLPEVTTSSSYSSGGSSFGGGGSFGGGSSGGGGAGSSW